MPLFSIIVPIYNVAPYLQNCISSVLEQSFSDYEIVLVDDGSTDDSVALCDYFAQKKNITLCRQQNSGLSVARNTGIQVATGDYIMFLDGDDLLAPTSLSQLAAVMEQGPADIWFGKYRLLFSNEETFLADYTVPVGILSARDFDYYHFLFKTIPQTVWSACRYVIRRQFLLSHHLFFVPGILCEDVEWVPRVLLTVDTVGFYPVSHYLYRYQRIGSIMTTGSRKRLEDLLQSICASLHLLDQHPTDSRLRPLYDALVREYLAQFVFLDKQCTLHDETTVLLKKNADILRYANSASTRILRYGYMLFGSHFIHTVMNLVRWYRKKYRRPLRPKDSPSNS